MSVVAALCTPCRYSWLWVYKTGMSRESECGNFRGTSFNLTPPKFAPCELQRAVVNIFPASSQAVAPERLTLYFRVGGCPSCPFRTCYWRVSSARCSTVNPLCYGTASCFPWKRCATKDTGSWLDPGTSDSQHGVAHSLPETTHSSLRTASTAAALMPSCGRCSCRRLCAALRPLTIYGMCHCGCSQARLRAVIWSLSALSTRRLSTRTP